MDDKEYETVTAALYQAMGESSGITIECFGSSCRVQGKSGSWYQIDVLTRQSNGLQTVRTAIECKYWQKRVTRNVVSNHPHRLPAAGVHDGCRLEVGVGEVHGHADPGTVPGEPVPQLAWIAAARIRRQRLWSPIMCWSKKPSTCGFRVRRASTMSEPM